MGTVGPAWGSVPPGVSGPVPASLFAQGRPHDVIQSVASFGWALGWVLDEKAGKLTFRLPPSFPPFVVSSFLFAGQGVIGRHTIHYVLLCVAAQRLA